MAENEDDIYKTVAKTKRDSDKKEIKERNKKSMSITKERNEPETTNDSNGNNNHLVLMKSEEKRRKMKEDIRLSEDERNVALRTDVNGDTVTRREKLFMTVLLRSLWKNG